MTIHIPRGRYLEEMIPGDIYRHEPGRTITEADNVLFCSITLNSQPLHLDAVKAAESPFGQRLVNSMLTLAILCSVGSPDLTQKTVLVNLGFGEVNFPAPVFIGDTLYCETEIIARRESQSRPDYGVVEFEHRARNQEGATVAVARRSVLVSKQPERVSHG